MAAGKSKTRSAIYWRPDEMDSGQQSIGGDEMTTTAENIHALNKMCDVHAEKFARSVYGRFTPEQVKRDIAKLVRFGYTIETKQDREKTIYRQSGNGDIGRPSIPMGEKRRIVAEVKRLSKKMNVDEAIHAAGTTRGSYYVFKKQVEG